MNIAARILQIARHAAGVQFACHTFLRHLKPLFVHSPRVGSDKEDVLICVAAPVDDAVEHHQLIRDSLIVLVDDAIVTVAIGAPLVAADHDSLIPVFAVL